MGVHLGSAHQEASSMPVGKGISVLHTADLSRVSVHGRADRSTAFACLPVQCPAGCWYSGHCGCGGRAMAVTVRLRFSNFWYRGQSSQSPPEHDRHSGAAIRLHDMRSAISGTLVDSPCTTTVSAEVAPTSRYGPRIREGASMTTYG